MIKIILVAILATFIVASIIFVVKSRLLKKRVMKKFNRMNTSASDKWTIDFLENKRNLTDDFADKTVNKTMARKDRGHTNQMFDLIVKDSDRLPDEAPTELKEYFAKTAILPEWADRDLIAFGQQIYIRHGIWISLLLSYKSLPECYACAKGAEVLHKTARLNEHHGSFETYSRRIAETAQFVMFAMSPGGLSPAKQGLVAAQKVRLIHGVIRYYLRQQNWDLDKFDQPVNQEDMAGTLMSFSALILQGLEQLEIKLEPVEKEAYFHCWRVIGHIVGLDDNLIPDNAADGLKLGTTILDHQIAKSTQGSSLMKALLEFQIKKSKGFISPQKNEAMMRLMMGNRISDLLDVPEVKQEEIDKLGKSIKRIARFMEILDHSMIFAMLLQFLTGLLSQMMIRHMTKSKIITFYIPKSLTLDWLNPRN